MSHCSRHLRLLFALTSVLVLVLSSPVHAQVWNENGDAGDAIVTAQTTIGTGSLTQINGTLSSATDVDIYCVQVGPSVHIPFVPVFALQCAVNQGPNVYVFDANGFGLAMNETCQGGSKLITNTFLPVSTPVTLYVAVGYYGNDPLTGAGSIWQPGLFGERAPDGSDPSSTLAGWGGIPNVQPINPYTIVVGGSGVVTSFCDAPVSTEQGHWGVLKGRYE